MPKVGSTLSLVPVTLLDGSLWTPAQAQGKVLVVYWWASWCPFCAVQSPHIEALWRAQKAHGLEVLALSIDREAAAAAHYIKVKGYSFPAGMLGQGIAQAGRFAGGGGIESQRQPRKSRVCRSRGNVPRRCRRFEEVLMKTLVIAEKPSVAQDIVRAMTPTAGKFEKHDEYFESDDWVITSAVGHLVEIQAPEEFDVKRGKWSFANLPVVPPHFDVAPIAMAPARRQAVL